MFNILDIKGKIIAGLIVLFLTALVVNSFYVVSLKHKISSVKQDLNKSQTLNAYYIMQFKALALSYNASLQEFQTQKTKIELKYKDRINDAKKIAPDKECEYLKQRIKEYVENNNSN